MKILMMCDGPVGEAICQWMISNFPQDLVTIVTVEENEVSRLAAQNAIPTSVFQGEERLLEELAYLEPVQLGILAWWPKLISRTLLNHPSLGFINTHPSYLPFNRGKHYNFWNLVESVPFGVTLHFVDEGIDSGDIIAQLRIPVGWEDNGRTLYEKAQKAMISLFTTSYPEIRKGNIPRIPQVLSEGSLHYSSELENASQINLEDRFSARELLNLLRARTFPGRPACRFIEHGDVYEVTINIKKINQ